MPKAFAGYFYVLNTVGALSESEFTEFKNWQNFEKHKIPVRVDK
jgi:hypothetical protein